MWMISSSIEWKDVSVDWVILKDRKQSNPIDLDEYAVANEISDEPVFKCWVKETLIHRNRIVSKIKSKYWRTSHKFGIRVLNTLKEAYEIDRQLGTDFWTKGIAKQMKNVHIAFQNFDGVTPDEIRKWGIKPRYEHVNVRMIFDIKMDGKFTIKAILLANIHTTALQSSITYSGVVSVDFISTCILK